MPTKSLRQFKAIIFDVYGTLVDWESGIFEAFHPLLKRANASWSRKEVLTAFSSVELELQTKHPEILYSELLVAVHAQIAVGLEVKGDPVEDQAFGQSIANWRVFPDTVEALTSLKKHFKLVVLSNVDNASFHSFTQPLLEPQGEGSVFDLILTAQDLKAYKPNPATFEVALLKIDELYGIKKDATCSVAQSLAHDHRPANAIGLSSVWIDREDALTCYDPGATYDFRFATLGELAEARDKEHNPE